MELNQYLSKKTLLKAGFIVLLTLSVLLRFSNLDMKVYWHDEVYTSLWVSGYSRSDVKEGLFTGEIITADDIQKYQQVKPGSSVLDTIGLLARYDTQHPPLYYGILRIWADIFGSSVQSIRACSALLSVLILPFLYWLGLELFKKHNSAAMMTILAGISPFNILYAQEARQYGLWMAMICFSSAALLYATRKKTQASWLLYALSTTLSLYTFILSILVMFAHGLYILWLEGWKLTRTLKLYLLASFVGCITFLPWLLVLITKDEPINAASWTAQPMPLQILIRSWVANASRIFFDINLDSNHPLQYTIPPLLLASALIVYSLFYLLRKAPTKTWLFILLLGGVSASAFIIPDLVLGGRRSSISRYLIPGWLSIQMIVAYWLGEKHGNTRIFLRYKVKLVIVSIVLMASLASSLAVVHSDTWWTKKNSHHHPQTARIINRINNPLLISSDVRSNEGEVLSLSHLLKPKTKVLLIREGEDIEIPSGFTEILLFKLSRQEKEFIEKAGHTIEPLYKEGDLWKISS